MIRTTALIGFAAALLLVGCEAAKPNAYDVSVTNKISRPVTVWITRSNPPYEAGWAPPEEVVAETPGNRVIGGVVVEPGVTVNAKISGKTTPDNPAMLRVYQATKIDEILSLSRGNPWRTEVVLDPGKSNINVLLDDGQLTADVHHTDAPPAK
jgi:hypothetical protein